MATDPSEYEKAMPIGAAHMAKIERTVDRTRASHAGNPWRPHPRASEVPEARWIEPLKRWSAVSTLVMMASRPGNTADDWRGMTAVHTSEAVRGERERRWRVRCVTCCAGEVRSR
ncbi:hypothetical protein SAV14893_077920 [Streptomyces avermitilis]|uniref:Uncharacterized protein n=1 Tax=Streptomyces avermitilis TaxID=33903 RepID=A0A4D4M9S9_STRAX|nr:hypothetical protein SAV14893_077920 [Streptomyces avermitilis]